MTLIFINLEMDVFMRLLTLVKRMYIQQKGITDKLNQRTEKNDCQNQSIIPQTCI